MARRRESRFDPLWRCFGMGRLAADVIFHEPAQLSQFASRKALGEYRHGRIAPGLSAALVGRLPPDSLPFKLRTSAPETVALPEHALTITAALETGRDI